MENCFFWWRPLWLLSLLSHRVLFVLFCLFVTMQSCRRFFVGLLIMIITNSTLGASSWRICSRTIELCWSMKMWASCKVPLNLNNNCLMFYLWTIVVWFLKRKRFWISFKRILSIFSFQIDNSFFGDNCKHCHLLPVDLLVYLDSFDPDYLNCSLSCKH